MLALLAAKAGGSEKQGAAKSREQQKAGSSEKPREQRKVAGSDRRVRGVVVVPGD